MGSQLADQRSNCTPCLGGEGVSTGQPGRSLPQALPWTPWAQPIHAPSPAPSVLPVSVLRLSECPHTDAASSGSSVTCPKLLLRSPPVVCLPSASLSAPLRPPVPRTSSGTWGSAADPHIPQFYRHGDGLGQSVHHSETPAPSHVVCGQGARGLPCQTRSQHAGRPPTARRGAVLGTSHFRVSAGAPGARRLPDQARPPVACRLPITLAPPRRGKCSRRKASPSLTLVLPGEAGRAPTPRTAPGVLTDRPGGHALSPSGKPGGEGNCLLWGVQ